MRVLIADDHGLLRDCLRVCLESTGVEVVGEAEDGHEAVAKALDLRPDILVCDISMPGLTGIEVARRVTSELGGACKVLAVTMHHEREFVTEMFRAGARGYVVKSAVYSELMLAIRTVAAGRLYVSTGVASALIGDLQREGGSETTDDVQLSRREREVLERIARGMNTKEIAYDLGISDKTVHAFRVRVMRKLNVQSVADLTRYAIRRGLVALT